MQDSEIMARLCSVSDKLKSGDTIACVVVQSKEYDMILDLGEPLA